MELFLLLVVVLAFVCEFVDSALGMGYGTTLTPVLLLLGFEPLQIVPAVLLSELISGFAAAFLHHRSGNVDFDFRNELGRSRRGFLRVYMPASRDARVAAVLGLCSVVGTVAAVFVALNIPKQELKLMIGVIVASMGVLILVRRGRSHTLSWRGILGLGVVASFNKGLSGGGYGPLVTGGQILSGMDGKRAVAVTSLSEGLTCLAGVIAYLAASAQLDWSLAPYLVAGAAASVPFSVKAVRRIDERWLTKIIGVLTLSLGVCTLWGLF
jgi:uncharacterized protein